MKTREGPTAHMYSRLFSSHIRGLSHTHNSLCLCFTVDFNAPAVLAEACRPVPSVSGCTCQIVDVSISGVPVQAALVRPGCCNKIPKTGCLINNRNCFLTVLEVERLR